MSVYIEIAAERHRQDLKWGGPIHDDGHDLLAFISFIRDYAAWARQMGRMNNLAKARRRLIQVAALAVTAVEWIDRRKEHEA